MAERPISYRDIFRLDDLPALLGATVLSRLASNMFSLTIVLYALHRFSSPALAGWFGFAAVLPGLVVSPVAGALLDRVGPAIAITVDMAVSAALIGLLLAADSLGWANPTVLLALVAAYSLTNPLSRAGVRTLLPRLVPPQALDRVNALDTAIYAAADVLGPSLAGLLTGFLGSSSALIAIALLYGGAALCIRLVRHVPGSGAAGVSLLRQAWDGIAVVIRQPTLRTLALSYSLYQITWGVLIIVVPVFAARHFAGGTGSSAAGLIWAATGLAGGGGALAAGHLRTRGRERSVMALGMMVTALAAWPLAAQFGVDGLVLGLLLAGAAAGSIDVGLLTLRQRRTDPSQLGRVLSVSMSLNVIGFPLGSALAGMLIAQSLSAAFLFAGLASALAALATMAIPKDIPGAT
jgi:MFS family permease